MLQRPQWQLVQRPLVIGSFLPLSHFLLVFPGILSPQNTTCAHIPSQTFFGEEGESKVRHLCLGDGTSGSTALAHLVARAAGLCDQSRGKRGRAGREMAKTDGSRRRNRRQVRYSLGRGQCVQSLEARILVCAGRDHSGKVRGCSEA